MAKKLVRHPGFRGYHQPLPDRGNRPLELAPVWSLVCHRIGRLLPVWTSTQPSRKLKTSLPCVC